MVKDVLKALLFTASILVIIALVTFLMALPPLVYIYRMPAGNLISRGVHAALIILLAFLVGRGIRKMG